MRKSNFILFLVCLIFLITSCGSKKATNSVKTLKSEANASYYADKFNGRKTASGEVFSNSKLTAAHRTLSFGTKIKVTNLVNNQSVEVIINDRGPFVKDREIDLSKKAFMQITDDKNRGILNVKLEFVD